MTKSTGFRAAWKPTPCKVAGCQEDYLAKGYCATHYHRARRYGDPLAGRPSKETVLAVMQSIAASASSECITWPFFREPTGYGRYNRTKAHREICRMAHGEPPTPKHEAAHSCGNGSNGCVNPNHLRWASHRENMKDMARHGTNNGKPLLTAETASLIRSERAAGRKLVDIARSLGLPYTVVHRASVGMTFNDKGRDHYRLTKDDVSKIRTLHGTMPAREIAARFKITRTHVYAIVNRRVWKEVA